MAALIPDADRPAAKIWTSIPYGRTIGRVADPFIKHRNISHSLLGAVLAGLVTYWLLDKFPDYWGIDQFYVFGAVMVAYLSHLLLDAVTSEGIPILFPFLGRMGLPPKPFDGVRIVTGKWFENYVIFPVVNVMLIAIVVVNWGEIRSVLFK
ncbi:MAG: Inner membrane protein YdjM [bacterium ADurb.Bin400]|nr:MAG: Inner membrane protein YdjM [bacterium ADurb.Bin400]